MDKGLVKEIIVLVIVILCIFGCYIVETKDMNTNKKNKVVTNEKVEKKDNLIETTNTNDNTNNSNDNTNVVVESDDQLVEYVENVELRVNDIVDKDEINEKDENILRNTFITLTDFIFYDGEIKGKKFSDLTESCKTKIIDIYTKIDNKIESKYPNYKENIKETSKKTYHNAVEKAKEVKENIVNKYKDYVGEESYNDTVDRYEEGKQNMKDVYDIYEPYIEEGKEKVKSGAQKAKEKLSEWYKNYKENGD